MTQREYTDVLTPEARASLVKEYHALCAQRDAAYARAKPIQAELDKANAETEQARLRAQALALKVEEAWGPGHFALKHKIGRLADVLRYIPAETA